MVLKRVCKATVVTFIVATTYILAFNKPADSSSQIRVIYEHVDASTLDQAHCLATNLYFEAGHQARREQEAIAHVVLNRVEDKSFPNTICGVVYQAETYESGFPIRHRCQFSWYCDGLKEIITDEDAWQKAYNTAFMITQIKRPELTQGSLYYHSIRASPEWRKEKEYVITVGRHIFYRE